MPWIEEVVRFLFDGVSMKIAPMWRFDVSVDRRILCAFARTEPKQMRYIHIYEGDTSECFNRRQCHICYECCLLMFCLCVCICVRANSLHGQNPNNKQQRGERCNKKLLQFLEECLFRPVESDQFWSGAWNWYSDFHREQHWFGCDFLRRLRRFFSSKKWRQCLSLHIYFNGSGLW